MEIIKGGFALSDADEKLVNQQRSITAQVNNSFIQVGAVFLKMAGKDPFQTDWHRRKFRDTNLQEWIDSPDFRLHNLGFNLQFGWLDVDIDSEDSRYNECLVKAFRFLKIDTRFAFGRQSKGVPTHMLVQLTESDQANYDELKSFAPKEFRVDGKLYKCELRSMAPIPESSAASVIKESRQTVVPGSIYAHKTKPNEYDISVWYGSDGKVATHISEIAATTSRRVNFSQLITGIAFGTMLYVVQPHWIEGGRQALATKVAGFLARLVRDSQGINESESARGTFCPIGTVETAESLIEFICQEMGDAEPFMRKRTFRDAVKKLENNPDAKIPGWPVLEASVGTEFMYALRTVFMPGIDVSPLTQMAERYVYDETSDFYIDRHRFGSTVDKFSFDGSALDRRHSNEFMEIAGKSRPIFKIFNTSPLRRSVNISDLYPDLAPGAIFRISRSGIIISDDQESEMGTTSVFNTWRGWPVQPTKNLDLELLKKCEGMLDQLFTYLCQDNRAQMNWLKKWLAWTVQFPGQKQQIAPVFVGGQGVGKSFFGDIFLGQLFQQLHGSASPKALEGDFSVEPFLNKIFVFMDEVKIYTDRARDEIKKLSRADRMGGAEKFQSARTHRVFARPIFASNRFDMNIGQANDRALFFIKTYDQDYIGKTAVGFEKWALTIKPFFTEYNKFIRLQEVKEHYMHLFNTIQVTREEIEDNSISSATDAHIVESNMSHPKRVAKYIIEQGRIWEDMDISAPFTKDELFKRINDSCDLTGVKLRNREDVISEFRSADLLEFYIHAGTRMYRFKWKIGTLTEMFSEHIGAKLEPRFDFTADDFGENKCEFGEAKPWRGSYNARFRI